MDAIFYSETIDEEGQRAWCPTAQQFCGLQIGIRYGMDGSTLENAGRGTNRQEKNISHKTVL